MSRVIQSAPSIASILREARLALQAALPLDSAEAGLEARVLLAHVLNKNNAYLLAHGGSDLTTDQQMRFHDLLQRRSLGVPIAYLTGQKEFYGLNFSVTEAVLIPRPETELLVDIALALIPPASGFRVLDLGTGSGAIAITLAKLRPQAHVTAIDVSPAALAVARHNAAQNGLSNIQFIESDWLSQLPSGALYDLIVANPPYIAEQDAHAQNGDLRFEPQLALLSGEDGLTALRTIVRSAGSFLGTSGHLLIEHGYDQRQACSALFAQNGFQINQVFDDMAGQPRCLIAKNSGERVKSAQ